MAGGKDLTYKVGVDASDAVSGLKKLDSTVKSTMRNVESELDDGATAGDKFAASIDQLSAQLKADFDKSATAAQELQRALKEAGSTLDTGEAISELSRLGFTFDEITADADKFANSLKQLDDVRLDGVKQLDAVAPGLATKLDGVGKSADSSKSVLANMVGNSVQDLGALSGVAGSAGVAIGQMGEYIADARASGEGFGSILRNFGTQALPIAGLGLALQGISGHFADIAKQKAFRTDQIKQWSDALRDGKTLLEAINDELAETGQLQFQGWDGIVDIVPILAGLGLKTEDWTAAVEGGDAAQQAFLQTVKDSGLSTAQFRDILVALKTESENYTAAQERSNDVQAVGTGLTTEMTEAWQHGLDVLGEAAGATDDSADSMDHAAAKARLLADKVAEFTNQYDIMSGRIDQDNAALDLADGFDAAHDAAVKAYLLIMDKSPEADNALRDTARAFNNVKQQVVDYHDELGRLPPEVITRINALVDQGDLAAAEAQLNNVTRNRNANIRIIANGGAGYGGVVPGVPRSVTPSSTTTATATTTAVPMAFALPTSKQITKSIGPIVIPVDIFIRDTKRLTGIRD